MKEKGTQFWSLTFEFFEAEIGVDLILSYPTMRRLGLIILTDEGALAIRKNGKIINRLYPRVTRGKSANSYSMIANPTESMPTPPSTKNFEDFHSKKDKKGTQQIQKNIPQGGGNNWSNDVEKESNLRKKIDDILHKRIQSVWQILKEKVRKKAQLQLETLDEVLCKITLFLWTNHRKKLWKKMRNVTRIFWTLED